MLDYKRFISFSDWCVGIKGLLYYGNFLFLLFVGLMGNIINFKVDSMIMVFRLVSALKFCVKGN